MLMLSDRTEGRNNNLNLIRMLAATGVLVSHAWPIALGSQSIQPLVRLTGHSMGTLAVYIFFVISGFLIAASFERSRSHTLFVASRIARLIPGIFVSVVLVALVMGPLVTSMNPVAYLTSPDPWQFIIRNTTLVWPQFTLAGVFTDNPYPTVEGSIWTLVHEAICYVGVFVAGLLGLISRRVWGTVAILALTLVWAILPSAVDNLHPRLLELHKLVLPFIFGTALYLWQDRVPLSLPLAVGLVLLTALVKGTAFYEITLIIALGYATFWLAYVPRGFLLAYNRLGDYSYGIYIYAFPMQGLAVWAFGPMTPEANILWSFPPTLALSILSWHLIEKPALGAREALAGWLSFNPVRKTKTTSD
ncbi:MAG: acyltransferase family protein [Arenibacterium sp.]